MRVQLPQDAVARPRGYWHQMPNGELKRVFAEPVIGRTVEDDPYRAREVDRIWERLQRNTERT